MEKNYFKCYELFHKIGKELPSELQWKYYVALMEYWLYGVEPTDTIIKSLLQWPIYSIQKTEEIRKKQSDGWKKHSWNQYTKWDTKREAQKKPVEVSGSSMEVSGTEWNKEDIEDIEVYRSNKKEINKEKSSTSLSMSELVREFECNDKLMRIFKWDIEPIKQRLSYKQSKRDRAYKTSKWFIQQMQVIVKDVQAWQPRWDIPRRFEFAVNLAMENERKWIFWDDKIEAKYQNFKSMNRTDE